MTDDNTFKIIAARLPELTEALNKANKKAKRYDTAPITIEISESYLEKYEDPFSGIKSMISYVDVTLIGGETPKVGDFEFLAKIEFTSEGNLVQTVPGVKVDTKYRTVDCVCEHCNINRYRKDCFLVAGADGEIVQVGRSCLRDFMGTDTPTKILSRFKWFKEIKELFEDGAGWTAPQASLLSVLTYTNVIIRLNGWVSKSSDSDKEPTASQVADALFPRNDFDFKLAKEVKENLTEADQENAVKALEWLANNEGDGDYLYNLRTITKADMIEAKRFGLVCSLAWVYQRAVATEIEKKEAKTVSNHIGNVKERMKGLEVKVLDTRVIDGYYGMSIMTKMVDKDGNIITWFNTGTTEMEVEKSYTIDATIKKHDEYKGLKQTLVTRVTVKA